jgi:hypothetical protein
MTLALHFGCTQFNELGPCHNIHSLIKKISYHQIGPASRCKGVGTDLSLLANHSKDFKPLTQRIGLASRCKAALSHEAIETKHTPTLVYKSGWVGGGVRLSNVLDLEITDQLMDITYKS